LKPKFAVLDVGCGDDPHGDVNVDKCRVSSEISPVKKVEDLELRKRVPTLLLMAA